MMRHIWMALYPIFFRAVFRAQHGVTYVARNSAVAEFLGAFKVSERYIFEEFNLLDCAEADRAAHQNLPVIASEEMLAKGGSTDTHRL